MAYSKAIEARIDPLTAVWPNIEKKRMFGGVCYLTDGIICFGMSDTELREWLAIGRDFALSLPAT